MDTLYICTTFSSYTFAFLLHHLAVNPQEHLYHSPKLAGSSELATHVWSEKKSFITISKFVITVYDNKCLA